MCTIAFDLVVVDTAQNHPKGVSQAYAISARRLRIADSTGSRGVSTSQQGEDLANLFAAIMALKVLPWLPGSVHDIRAFRLEQWSDFTSW